ncbi:hypothetical protein CEXT_224191 [Caerostris extrusa]|uniref:Ycf15 n=1 Tax=Caerostris extrusa TaxID=172846 RepID=A0AAV4T084_CAEEX|nr:hypothetical protein CEXT_224191 [Caerostris extrusa]
MADLHVRTGVPLTLMSWEKRRYHLQTIRQDILNYACTCPADKLQVLLQIGALTHLEIYIWCQSNRFLNRSNHFRLSHGKYPETIHAIDYPTFPVTDRKFKDKRIWMGIIKSRKVRSLSDKG